MAIVIDAERPHACWACDYRCGLNIIARTEEEGVHDDCPIIGEIPDKHGRLIDADELQDVLGLVLSLVVSNELTEKEISLVHRTIGAISKAINDLDTVLEARNG